MKHSEILKRAWKILWDYKALWIFGIILMLTTASNTGNNFNWNSNNQRDNGREMQFNPDEDFWPQMGEEIEEGLDEAVEEMERILASENTDKLERNIFIAIISFVSLVLVLSIIGTVLKYIARTALIKMVDRYEETAEKLKARQGWGLGWSKEAWHLFLVDLIVFLPAFVVGAIVFSLAIVPIITITSGMPAMGVLGLVASIGLILLLSLAGLIFGALVSLVRPVVYRKVVLEELGAFEGIKAGWQMFRAGWKQYGLMWLILKGIDLVWPLVMFPFALLSGGIGLLLGGGFTFLTGGRAIEAGDPSMVWSIVIGVILFILVLVIPLAFLGGLRETYQSTSWTLAYREMKAEGLLANGNGGTLLLPEDEPEA
jgi:hypothetical protein